MSGPCCLLAPLTVFSLRLGFFYLHRVLVKAPRPLHAILHVRVKGKPLPWVALLKKDLGVLRYFNSIDIEIEQTERWYDLISCDQEAWSRMVANIRFSHSVLDGFCASAMNVVDQPSLSLSTSIEVTESSQFLCSMCSDKPKFSSSKALSLHLRLKHKIRPPVRCFSSGATCPVCLVTFSSRPLVIYHLGDSRRPKCRESLLVPGAYPMMPECVVKELDEKDRLLRLSHDKTGFARIISDTPAVTVSGRVLGRCTRSVR